MLVYSGANQPRNALILKEKQHLFYTDHSSVTYAVLQQSPRQASSRRVPLHSTRDDLQAPISSTARELSTMPRAGRQPAVAHRALVQRVRNKRCTLPHVIVGDNGADELGGGREELV